MSRKPESGRIFGIPYNFERPSVRRLFGAYWRPGEGMIVEKPFGIGYTLNLANWRSWVVLAVAGVMLFLERRSADGAGGDGNGASSPIEIVVDDEEEE